MEPLFLAIGDKEISTSKRMHFIKSKNKDFSGIKGQNDDVSLGLYFLSDRKHWCHGDC